MASERFCGVYHPHDSHEWYEDHAMMVGGALVSSLYRCWGVKEAPEVAMALRVLEEAQARVERLKEELAEIATPHRRTEAEFYGGDGTRCRYCLDSGPCEECSE